LRFQNASTFGRRPFGKHEAGFALYQGMASAWLQPCLVSPSYGTAEQAAEKASNRVILSGAKDLLFVYFQGETIDASLRSA
jgi:hypothetical protein